MTWQQESLKYLGWLLPLSCQDASPNPTPMTSSGWGPHFLLPPGQCVLKVMWTPLTLKFTSLSPSTSSSQGLASPLETAAIHFPWPTIQYLPCIPPNSFFEESPRNLLSKLWHLGRVSKGTINDWTGTTGKHQDIWSQWITGDKDSEWWWSLGPAMVAKNAT
jgi:hypothetical protein